MEVSQIVDTAGLKESQFVPEVPNMRCVRVPYLINFCSVLSTKQIALAVYGNGKYGLWKAQTDLKKLYDAKMVKRLRCMSTKDYLYYVDNKPEFPDHDYLVNWVWLSMNRMGKLEKFKKEMDLGTHVADAYFVYDKHPYFLELHHLRKEFDKVPLYTQHFKIGSWVNENWPGGKQYAMIMVVVVSEKDKSWINNIIEKENTVPLRFKVVTLKEFWESPEEALMWG